MQYVRVSFLAMSTARVINCVDYGHISPVFEYWHFYLYLSRVFGIGYY